MYTLIIHPPHKPEPLVMDGLSLAGACRWYAALGGRWIVSFGLDAD